MENLILDKLQSLDYYINKLPIYLRQSYGFIEHFKIWHEILVGQSDTTGVVGSANTLLHLLNIFDKDYLTYISNLEGSGKSEDEPYGTVSDMLDKIAHLFAVKRKFTITDKNNNIVSFSLNNEDLLILIKAQIVKNYCDGSREIISKYYKDVGLLVLTKTSGSAQVNLQLIDKTKEGNVHQYSDNVRTMFLNNLLTIESMGIIYTTAILDLSSAMLWDTYKTWDEGEWGI